MRYEYMSQIGRVINYKHLKFSIVLDWHNERMLFSLLLMLFFHCAKLTYLISGLKFTCESWNIYELCVWSSFFSFLFLSGPRLGKLFRKETLHKVHSEWLIPLRPIVTGIQSENEKDDSEIANQIVCSVNPVQLVLYRCIELVEEKMKSC